MLRNLVLILSLLLPGSGAVAKNVALIIGNETYSDVTPLQKAVADAQAVSARMTAAGFETILATDVNRRDFNLRVAQFTSVLEPGDTAFLFYAGHGVEIAGENYLLPTDILAPVGAEPDFVTAESIALSDLLDRIRRTGARATIAVIDACRDNPFAAGTGRSIGRSRGLGRIAAPEGTFVLFSAGAGQQALDRLNDTDTDDNSVFTRLLLPKIGQDGLELRDLVSDLRVEVRNLARTQNHAQFPAYYDELLGEFYFATVSRTRTTGSEATPLSTDHLREDFSLARQVGTDAALRAFLDKYAGRDDFTITLARQLLEEGQGDPAPEPAALPVTPAPISPARELIAASQSELNRLGCNAGGADGIAGARTRAAFRDFLQASGTPLQVEDLGTSAALSALRGAKAPVCKPQTVARAPDPASAGLNVAGTWRYVSKCPLLITSTGTVVLRQTGANRYAGQIRDSIVKSGTSRIVLNGRDFSSALQFSTGPATENGRFSADGRSYSSSTSTGCKVRGTRVN